MRRSAILFSTFFIAVLALVLAAPTAFGQKGCEFQIAGKWKAVVNGETNPGAYTFAREGTVTVVSDSRAAKQATYTLDDFAAPKRITFTTQEGTGVLPAGMTSMDVTAFGDDSFTTRAPGGKGEISWVRVDPFKYYLILAGHRGEFYDKAGPTFPMLIKTDGRHTQTNAVGIYSQNGNGAFGVIPAATYQKFMKDSDGPSNVMFRIELTGGQYERSLVTINEWKHRAEHDELLYSDPFLDNVLLVKAVAEGLNVCHKTIKMYNMDWGFTDRVAEYNTISNMPFKYFEELKRLNEDLHVSDRKFQQEVTGSSEQSPSSGR